MKCEYQQRRKLRTHYYHFNRYPYYDKDYVCHQHRQSTIDDEFMFDINHKEKLIIILSELVLPLNIPLSSIKSSLKLSDAIMVYLALRSQQKLLNGKRQRQLTFPNVLAHLIKNSKHKMLLDANSFFFTKLNDKIDETDFLCGSECFCDDYISNNNSTISNINHDTKSFKNEKQDGFKKDFFSFLLLIKWKKIVILFKLPIFKFLSVSLEKYFFDIPLFTIRISYYKCKYTHKTQHYHYYFICCYLYSCYLLLQHLSNIKYWSSAAVFIEEKQINNNPPKINLYKLSTNKMAADGGKFFNDNSQLVRNFNMMDIPSLSSYNCSFSFTPVLSLSILSSLSLMTVSTSKIMKFSSDAKNYSEKIYFFFVMKSFNDKIDRYTSELNKNKKCYNKRKEKVTNLVKKIKINVNFLNLIIIITNLIDLFRKLKSLAMMLVTDVSITIISNIAVVTSVAYNLIAASPTAVFLLFHLRVILIAVVTVFATIPVIFSKMFYNIIIITKTYSATNKNIDHNVDINNEFHYSNDNGLNKILIIKNVKLSKQWLWLSFGTRKLSFSNIVENEIVKKAVKLNNKKYENNKKLKSFNKIMTSTRKISYYNRNNNHNKKFLVYGPFLSYIILVLTIGYCTGARQEGHKIFGAIEAVPLLIVDILCSLYPMLPNIVGINLVVPTNCTFPQKWEGSWFLSGYQQSIHIKGSLFSYRGKCTASDGNKYLIVDEKGCHRCLVIYEKHTNVLQYKESECDGDSYYMAQSNVNNPAAMPIRSIINSDRVGGAAHPNSRFSSLDSCMGSYDDPSYCKGREILQNLCDQIPGDALLYSLFRQQAEPVKCPLKGPYTFTYNRGHGECKNPVSNIDSCTEESRLLLSFQACPDVHGTESTVEELTCLATWKDGNSRYLVGLVSHHHAITNEDRFRCFVYEKISTMIGAFSGQFNNPNLKDAEYKLAQSGDATCNGLDSAEVGSRIMTLRKPPPAERCDFPIWLKGPRHWYSLKGNFGYQFHNSDGSMHITRPNGYTDTRAFCEQINKQTTNEMTAVVHFTSGCKKGFMCMTFYRRDIHIAEIQMGQPASRLEDACLPDHFDLTRMTYTTLLASNSESSKCPTDGLYHLLGAIGPPNVISRHKRNHNNNNNHYNGNIHSNNNCDKIKGQHNQNGHQHHQHHNHHYHHYHHHEHYSHNYNQDLKGHKRRTFNNQENNETRIVLETTADDTLTPHEKYKIVLSTDTNLIVKRNRRYTTGANSTDNFLNDNITLKNDNGNYNSTLNADQNNKNDSHSSDVINNSSNINIEKAKSILANNQSIYNENSYNNNKQITTTVNKLIQKSQNIFLKNNNKKNDSEDEKHLSIKFENQMTLESSTLQSSISTDYKLRYSDEDNIMNNNNNNKSISDKFDQAVIRKENTTFIKLNTSNQSSIENNNQVQRQNYNENYQMKNHDYNHPLKYHKMIPQYYHNNHHHRQKQHRGLKQHVVYIQREHGNYSKSQVENKTIEIYNETQRQKQQKQQQPQRNRRNAPSCTVNYKAQRQLRIGCTDLNQIDVRPQCDDENEVYVCYGSWTENMNTFIIAKNLGTQQLICLTYIPFIGNEVKLVIGDECFHHSNNGKQSEHLIITNITRFGQCGDSSSAKSKFNQISYVILPIIPMWMHAVNIFR